MKKLISLLLICIMIFSLCACSSDNKNSGDSTNDSNKIDLNKYVSVNFEGYNLAGYGSVDFDKETFLLENIKNISFNQKNLAVYKELYGETDESAAKSILKYISVNLDKQSKLNNGNTVKLVWEINTDKVNTYFKCDYIYTTQTFTVSGLKEAPTFDAFENIKVNFSVIAPYGKADITNSEYSYGTFNITPNKNLKNGDKVTVSFSCEDKDIMIEKYNKYPSSYGKTYTVSGLNTYVQSVDKLSNKQLNKLVSDARETLGYKDAKYCGNYFHYTKTEPIREGNAIHLIFENQKDYDSRYTYIVMSHSNLVINEKGELIFDYGESLISGYESQEKLNKAFIDDYEDEMYCSNNVKFE